MEKTPKNDAGKKASEVVAICDHPNFNVYHNLNIIPTFFAKSYHKVAA